MKKKIFVSFFISAIVLINGLNVCAKNVRDFKDVSQDDWYYRYASYVSDRNLMTGLDDVTFGASRTLPRAQFATILYRMAGSPEIEYAQKFSDIKKNEFYSLAVTWAEANNIITGYEDGRFGPNDYITREQMVTMLYRYWDSIGADTSGSGFYGFKDGNKVSGFAKWAMHWAVGQEIIKGDNGYLRPADYINRAECATIIARLYSENMIDNPHEHEWEDIIEDIYHEEISYYEEYEIVPATDEWIEYIPIYELDERSICNGCGEDITGRTSEHMEEAMLAGRIECGGYHSEYEKIQVGTEELYHPAEPAVMGIRKVIVEEEWIESKVLGRMCIHCGFCEYYEE